MINNLYIKATPTTASVTWGDITGTLSDQTDLQSALNAKQDTLTLTTTGTSGAATLVGSTLNIPQYGGGSGLVGLSNINGYFPTTSFGIDAAITAVTVTNYFVNNSVLISYMFRPNKTITSVSLRINCTTAAASNLARILIYSDNNGLPNTKLYESANLDLSTTGEKTALTSFTFNAGTTYWLTLNTSGTGAALTGLNTGALSPIYTSTGASASFTAFSRTTIFGSAPTTYTYSSQVNTVVPRIIIMLS